MERIGQCHCGSFRILATGDPDRVYLCHCKACQRRTGTAFHFGTAWARTQVRIEGEHKVFERGADSGSNIRFYFCPDCGSNLYWESDRNPLGCGIAGGRVWGASDSKGGYVKDRPVTPEDFGATLFHALDVAPETRLGLDGFTRPASEGGPILDLFG